MPAIAGRRHQRRQPVRADPSQMDETTGLQLLKLPDGFRYWSYSWTGDELSDGVRVPEPPRRHGGGRRLALSATSGVRRRRRTIDSRRPRASDEARR